MCPTRMSSTAAPVSSATISILTKRHSKVYVADLIAPLQRGDPAYWQQEGKLTLFRLDRLLEEIPPYLPQHSI